MLRARLLGFPRRMERIAKTHETADADFIGDQTARYAKRAARIMEGTIAPTSRKELEAVRKEYRMYSLIYPFMYLFSLLDKLVPGRGGYAVAVAARKPG